MRVVEQIHCPTWALDYLYNGNSDTLSINEQYRIDGWLDGLTNEYGPVHFDHTHGDEYFCINPEWGSDSDCVWLSVFAQ